MDYFGIGVAARGAFRAVLLATRGTGRTTRLVADLRENDIVVVLNADHGRALERKARDAGKSCRWVAAEPLIGDVAHGRVAEKMRGWDGNGRLIFDHAWTEAYYDQVLVDAGSDLDRLASAYRMRHLLLLCLAPRDHGALERGNDDAQ